MDWENGVEHALVDFFSSQVFRTLVTMGVLLLPALFYPQMTWCAPPGSSVSLTLRCALDQAAGE